MTEPLPTPKPPGLQTVEAWWPMVARILAFIFGLFLLYREQLPPPGVEEWIVMAAIGCMGPTVASAVATVIDAARGGTPGEPG